MILAVGLLEVAECPLAGLERLFPGVVMNARHSPVHHKMPPLPPPRSRGEQLR